jgi:hypothetical protein
LELFDNLLLQTYIYFAIFHNLFLTLFSNIFSNKIEKKKGYFNAIKSIYGHFIIFNTFLFYFVQKFKNINNIIKKEKNKEQNDVYEKRDAR